MEILRRKVHGIYVCRPVGISAATRDGYVAPARNVLTPRPSSRDDTAKAGADHRKSTRKRASTRICAGELFFAERNPRIAFDISCERPASTPGAPETSAGIVVSTPPRPSFWRFSKYFPCISCRRSEEDDKSDRRSVIHRRIHRRVRDFD